MNTTNPSDSSEAVDVPSPAEAARLLDGVQEAKTVTASQSKAPPGYYTALSIGVGLAILGASSQVPGHFALLIGAWVFWLMMILAAAGLAATLWTDSALAAAISAAAVVLSWSVLGPLWDRAYVAQLRSKQ